MIPCPRCGQYQVCEELHVPLPTRKVGGLLDPFRGKLVAVMVTLSLVVLMLWIGQLLPGGVLGTLGSTCLIALVSLALLVLPFILLAALFWQDMFGPKDRWPRVYRRVCQACDYRWSWRPGESQAEAPVSPDQVPAPRPAPPPERRATQAFFCPQCGHRTFYDPWVESARCERCGFGPPTGARRRSYLAAVEKRVHQPLLDELLSYWDGSHTPDPDFGLERPEQALLFFETYQRTLGESPTPQAAERVLYLREYHPRRDEILAFVGAYLYLRRGERKEAARRFKRLIESCPGFADAWLWLSATTDDPAERRRLLREARAREPAHPLVRDAWAVATGRVPLTDRRPMEDSAAELVSAQCAQCGGTLHYEPGASQVVCPYCGHALELEAKPGEGASLGDLQLARQYQGHVWDEVERFAHCRACGAQLVTSGDGVALLAQQCPFCGSTSVLVEDNPRTIERPDAFVPFRIDERQAADAIGRGGRVGGWQGVYVPFWLFDGVVEVRWWSRAGSRGPLLRLGQQAEQKQVENLLFSGVHVPPPSFLEPVQRFDLSGLVAYQPQLLADWPAQLYTLDVEGAAQQADNAMMTLARRQAGLPILWRAPAAALRGGVGVRGLRSFQTHSLTYQLVLLPFWVAPLRGERGPGLALVNGQTGQAVVCP